MTRLGAVAAAYGAASVVGFGLYALDKRRAVRGGRRVPERTLHLVEALGGFPGAYLASAMLRHKTRKRGFRVVRAALALAHAAAWALALRAG